MKETIKLPGWLNHSAQIIYHDDHHMSATTVEIKLPFKLENETRFFTTNGKAFLSDSSSILYIYDATIVLKVNCKSRSVEHLLPPKDCYINKVEEYENGLGFKYFGPKCTNEEVFISNSELEFKTGLGPVNNGLFPSAYKPAVEYVLKST